MKLDDLIKSYSWPSVEIIFQQLYPDENKSIVEYEKVFNDLKLIPLIETDIAIKVSIVIDAYDGEKHIDVSGYYTNQQKLMNDITRSLAIEFTPWNQWLGMNIDKQSLVDFSEIELISHCLFEMTFFSFAEVEIQEEFGRINDTIEEVKNMTEEEKKKKLVSIDQIFKGLNNTHKGEL